MGWNYNIPHKAGEHTDLSPDSADNLMGDNLNMKNMTEGQVQVMKQ